MFFLSLGVIRNFYPWHFYSILDIFHIIIEDIESYLKLLFQQIVTLLGIACTFLTTFVNCNSKDGLIFIDLAMVFWAFFVLLCCLCYMTSVRLDFRRFSLMVVLQISCNFHVVMRGDEHLDQNPACSLLRNISFFSEK